MHIIQFNGNVVQLDNRIAKQIKWFLINYEKTAKYSVNNWTVVFNIQHTHHTFQSKQIKYKIIHEFDLCKNGQQFFEYGENIFDFERKLKCPHNLCPRVEAIHLPIGTQRPPRTQPNSQCQPIKTHRVHEFSPTSIHSAIRYSPAGYRQCIHFGLRLKGVGWRRSFSQSKENKA